MIFPSPPPPPNPPRPSLSRRYRIRLNRDAPGRSRDAPGRSRDAPRRSRTLWLEHNLASATCKLSAEERKHLEDEITHLFAEHAGAGERNGFMAGRLARGQHRMT